MMRERDETRVADGAAQVREDQPRVAARKPRPASEVVIVCVSVERS